MESLKRKLNCKNNDVFLFKPKNGRSEIQLTSVPPWLNTSGHSWNQKYEDGTCIIEKISGSGVEESYN